MKFATRLFVATFAFVLLAHFDFARSEETTDREIYIPRELRNQDWNDPDSQWTFDRSKSSERCVVFWEKGFGDDPNGESVPENMRVDVDELLNQAEKIYQVNVKKLGFGGGTEASGLDKYKLEIYLRYTEDWLATGSGYDNVVGALWISPATCRPIGATIGHELGHAFQYQVACDHALRGDDPESVGFRYACENGLGNTIWEQCAQWQSFQVYPKEVFTWFHRETWAKNCHRAIEHEWTRYQNYWIFYALKDLHGAKVVADVWKRSKRPEDFLGAYKRLYRASQTYGMGIKEYPGGSLPLLYQDLYYYASHVATFDFVGVPAAPTEWLDSYRPNMIELGDGALQPAYSSCPSETGINVIPLDPKAYGESIVAEFTALPIGSPLADGDPGEAKSGEDGEKVAERQKTYNTAGKETFLKPAHRFGFVVLRENGARVYNSKRHPDAFVLGDAFVNKYGDCQIAQLDRTVTFEFPIPEDAARLYFVVLGAASRHIPHKWDNDERNDVQLPYKVKFRAKEETP